MYVVRVSKNPNFGPKTSCFFYKMDIFSGPKIFQSGSAVSLHRVLSNEVSHNHSSMYMVRLTKHRAKGGKKAKKGPKGAEKGPKWGQTRAQFCFCSLNTMSNGLKCKKQIMKIFGPLKIAIFGQNLMFFGQKWPFSDPKGHFFLWAKFFFDSIIWRTHLERHFELSYAPIPQCMWTGSAKNPNFGPKTSCFVPK